MWTLLFIVAGTCGGILASNKNRNVFGWFVLCLLIPLCVLILLCLPTISPQQEELVTKKCPFCAEEVKAEARVCKHCGKDFPILPAQCLDCVHFNDGSMGSEKRTCSAYPGGIPRELWENEVVHSRPFEGDGGVRFMKKSS